MFWRSMLAGSLCLLAGTVAQADGPIVVTPAEVQLSGNFARAQLVVSRPQADGQIGPRSEDLTSHATFASSDPAIVTVNSTGQLLAVADGQAKIAVAVGESKHEVSVTIAGVVPQPAIHFSRDIRPILTKSGCAMAACHAAQHGKGGFKLSVFGFEPEKDREAMVRDSQAAAGRLRRARAEPACCSSRRCKCRTAAASGWRRARSITRCCWPGLRGGAPAPAKDEPEVAKLHVFPDAAGRPGRPVAATARRSRICRRHAARCDRLGPVRLARRRRAERHAGRAGDDGRQGAGRRDGPLRRAGRLSRLFVVPVCRQASSWPAGRTTTSSTNWRPPSSASWASSLRRCATTPRSSAGPISTPSARCRRPRKRRRFCESTDPDKRAKLVDRLLGLTGDPAHDIYNDAYAAYWALKWSDLLRNNSGDLGEQGMWAMHNWIRESFRANKPFDKFVRELITARGSIYSDRPGELLPHPQRLVDAGRSDGPAVPRRAAGVCQVPPSSVREVQPGRLLRLGGVLRPRRHEEQRGVRPVRRRAGR